ncbi:hypothetical protein B5V03_19145 [Bradyrhizobium betae]|uniref:Uncharacterized protein n=1 Tax=Bradyrhizobium betae TaxID=244734 RepID=A0A4Q1V3L0_9BRAD|nr:hypothetical protein B5V03_19145 [Bradyrhizobium betae]
MATGLSALSAMDGLAREVPPRSRMDQPQVLRRLVSGGFSDRQQRSGAMVAETAVSAQKHIEIMFGGAGASCYPWFSMGAEGITTNTSHRPN